MVLNVKVDLCNLKRLKVIYWSKWAVSSKTMTQWTPYNVEKVKHNKLIK